MKKNGFTLVEVIGVIALLAIIFAITVPTLIGVMDRSKENAYNVQIQNIIQSAKNYVTEYKFKDENLQVVGQLNRISLSLLNSTGFLELPIKNPLTNQNFDTLEVEVRTIRLESGLYQYCFYDSNNEKQACNDFR